MSDLRRDEQANFGVGGGGGFVKELQRKIM